MSYLNKFSRSNYMELRPYQKEAAEAILKAYNNNTKEGQLILPTGIGRYTLLLYVIDTLIQDNKEINILCLFNSALLKDQFENELKKFSHMSNSITTPRNITLYTINEYQHQLRQEEYFDIIIYIDLNSVSKSIYSDLKRSNPNFILTVSNSPVNNLSFPILYKIGYSDLYGINEKDIIDKLIIPILNRNGYKVIPQKNTRELFYFDALANKGNSIYYFDIKSSLNKNISTTILNKAISNIIKSKQYLNKSENIKFILVILTSVNCKYKTEVYINYGIEIWDINNIIYFCLENKELYDYLVQLIPYNINDIEPLPVDFRNNSQPVEQTTTVINNNQLQKDSELDLINRLSKCKPGNNDKASIEYENICTDIITYLFEEKFNKFSVQHKTQDNLFRMDLICSLKGTNDFWGFLKSHYNTHFVVFEFKNYKNEIEQNLIYITDKYLFNPALRNVAFIISRTGFNNNAKKAAEGSLKERNKLIIDLTDDDLITMIHIKRDGREPSDYLQKKFEEFLMGISI